MTINTKPTVSLLDGALVVQFPTRSRDFERYLAAVRSLPERSFKKKFAGRENVWLVPPRLLPELKQVLPDATISQTVNLALAEMKEKAAMSRQVDTDFDVPVQGGELRGYQKVGVQFLEAGHGSGFIGDDMGLGKTLQTIGYLSLHPEVRPVLVVCPSVVKGSWRSEFAKWYPREVHIIQGQTPYELPAADVYLVNYEILSHWADVLTGFGFQMIVGDEAHRLCNRKTKQAAAFLQIRKAATKCILLTGTPMRNRPKELWPLLNLVAPLAWPNAFKFGLRYCGGTRKRIGWDPIAKADKYAWDFDGSSNREELHRAIAPYVLRRLKSEVLAELPPKQRVRVPIYLSATQRAGYDKIVQKYERRLQEAGSKAGAVKLEMIEALRQAVLAIKMKAAQEWADDFLAGDGKLVMFALHREATINLYEHNQGKAVRVIGGISQRDRLEAEDRFQNDPAVRLFVGNIDAAGEGLTLTAASDLCMVEFPWTPGRMRQAEDRIHRIGQTGTATIWQFVAEDTIDADILDLLSEKYTIIQEILDGGGDQDLIAELENTSVLGELLGRVTP